MQHLPVIDYYQESANRNYIVAKAEYNTPQSIGTRTHSLVNNDMTKQFTGNYILNNLPYIENILTEQNYYEGDAIGFNKSGSVRVDLIIYSNVDNTLCLQVQQVTARVLL